MSAAFEVSSYVCTLEIPGHGDSINALAFSPDGLYLASGGDDGVLLIVDPAHGRIIHKLRVGIPVTALHWNARASYELFVGVGDGQILVVRVEGEDPSDFAGYYLPRYSRKGPVDTLQGYYEEERDYLVVGAGPDVSVWTRVVENKLPIWTKHALNPPASAIPPAEREGALVRTAHIANGKTVIATYLGHGILCWSLHTQQFLWSMLPRTARMGRSAISHSGTLLAASNLYDGIDVYDLEDRTYVGTCRTTLRENIPLPVILTHDESEIIVGSASGEVRVFDPTTSREIQALNHNGDIIQALAYCDIEGATRLLASGSSERGDETIIKIWQRNLPAREHRDAHATGSLGRRQLRAVSPLHRCDSEDPSADGLDDRGRTPKRAADAIPTSYSQRSLGRASSLPVTARAMGAALATVRKRSSRRAATRSPQRVSGGALAASAQYIQERIAMPPTATETFVHLVHLVTSAGLARASFVWDATRHAAAWCRRGGAGLYVFIMRQRPHIRASTLVAAGAVALMLYLYAIGPRTSTSAGDKPNAVYEVAWASSKRIENTPSSVIWFCSSAFRWLADASVELARNLILILNGYISWIGREARLEQRVQRL